MATRLSRFNDLPSERCETEVSLDVALVKAAEELGIDVAQACEAGLAVAVSAERRARWLEENAEAIVASNAWVAEHGLPLDKYRLF